MVLHPSLASLLLELVILLNEVLGSLLEVVHGPLRVGSLYTIGVIFGGCFSLIVKVENDSKN